MSSSLKESETIQYMSWGNKEFITRPSPRVLSLAILMIFVGSILGLIASMFIEIDRTIDAVGESRYLSEPIKISISEAVTISKVFVHSGHNVQKGDPLLEYIPAGSQKSVVLTSPEAAQVARVRAQKGSHLDQGSEVIVLLTHDSPILVEAYISHIDLAKLKQDLKAKIDFPALPDTKYNRLNARVIGYELLPSEVSSDDSAQPLSYKVSMELNTSEIEMLSRAKILPGMIAQAQIVWAKEPLFRVLKAYLGE